MNDLKSRRLAQATGLTLIDRIVRLIKQAGAQEEADTDRDGFLSYHAESHAAGAGIAVGFLAVASGEWRILGAMLALAIYGNRGEDLFEPKLLADIKQERHYFLAALVVGAVLAIGVRAAVDAGALPTPDFVPMV